MYENNLSRKLMPVHGNVYGNRHRQLQPSVSVWDTAKEVHFLDLDFDRTHHFPDPSSCQ